MAETEQTLDSSKPETEIPARERLITAGAAAFAEKGFGGASIRDICKRANTSSNMVHHYFGSKQGLYDEILAGFSDRVFGVPIRIITEPPRSLENLTTRLEIFISETLEELAKQPDVFRLVVREQVIFKTFKNYSTQLVRFLEAGKEAGIVRQELDPEMLTGMVLDRIGNQILYASWIEAQGGDSIMSDGPYRQRWMRANIDLMLNGILTKP